MRMILDHLKPSVNNGGVLCKHLNSRQKGFLDQLCHENAASLNTSSGEIFVFNKIVPNIEGKQVVITFASHNGAVCGLSLFEIIPVKDGSSLMAAEMHRLDNNVLNIIDIPLELFESRLAFKVAKDYRESFCGIGTTLLSTSIYFAASLGLPFLQAREDISIYGNPQRRSFYEANGFLQGLMANKLLRQMSKGDIIPHTRSNKVFYLNGFLDHTIVNGKITEFTIPIIDIKKRQSQHSLDEADVLSSDFKRSAG